MKTPPAKPSALSTFLGEAGSPEATVKVEVTGSPAAVQKAIGKLAKKPKKPGANGGGPPMPKEEPDLEPDGELDDLGGDDMGPGPDDGGGPPAGDDLPPPSRDDDEPPFEDLRRRAANVVEALIREVK